MNKLEDVREVLVLKASDADMIVLRTERLLSVANHQALKTEWAKLVKGTKLESIPVAILDGDLDIRVVKRETGL